MLDRIRDLAAEAKGHRTITRNIREAIENGDRDAAEVFRTGTLAALTRSGGARRDEEITEYGRRVAAADGNYERVHRLRHR